MKREDIYKAIDAERIRQEELHPGETCAERIMDDAWKLTILMEEVGEVARAILEDPLLQTDKMRKELTEVAACAVAWLESIGVGGD